MNRFLIEQQLAGVRDSLKQANEKLMAMYSDVKTKITDREEQAKAVKDLEEREEGLKAQLDKLDKEAEAKLKAEHMAAKKKAPVKGDSEKERIISAKATLIKSAIAHASVPQEVYDTLGDGSSLGNGGNILPSTMINQLLHEPIESNPLRGISKFTNETNLEIPKVEFTLADDDFIEDGETAKELSVSADVIKFDRNINKVYCSITDTILRGTNTNLVETVNQALIKGVGKKEKKVAFATDAAATTMSFYHKTGENYDIKEVEGPTMFKAIVNALADLEDDYSGNTTVVMKKTDYYNILSELANDSSTLYSAQPSQVLGANVVFCDLATIPVVGDFNYSHFNYDLDMIYDTDKDVKTGINYFVVTAYFDHKITMKSAFRLAKVTP